MDHRKHVLEAVQCRFVVVDTKFLFYLFACVTQKETTTGTMDMTPGFVGTPVQRNTEKLEESKHLGIFNRIHLDVSATLQSEGFVWHGQL